jgi:hypothetical protein
VKLVTAVPSVPTDAESPTTFLTVTQNQKQFIAALFDRKSPPPPLSADPHDYVLVYDSEKDSFELVLKSVGLSLFSVVQFTTAQSVQAEDTPTKVHRVSSMTFPALEEATGTAIGFRKTDGSKWTASFIVTIPADSTNAQSVPINLSGTFSIGKVFR